MSAGENGQHRSPRFIFSKFKISKSRSKKMNRKLNYRQILTTLFSAAFVFIVGLSTVQNAEAQRRFDPKSVGAENELKTVANFTQELVTFLKQADDIDQKGAASEVEFGRLQSV